MNLKDKMLLTAMGLTMLGGSLPGMAATVDSDEHIEHAKHPQQSNRHHYNSRAQLYDYMPAAERENTARPENGVVFEQVGFLQGKTYFTDAFEILHSGTYEVTLTDFNFPKPLKMAGLNITTATESLGSLMATGSFTFDANPGNYYLSFFGDADHLGQYGIKVAQYGILISAVNASPVPVPGAAWLLGSGLVGLVGFMRRKSA